MRPPSPFESAAAFFVREAWPSRWTHAEISEGILQDKPLEVFSEMHEDGVIFGDGLEYDRLEFNWGARALVRCAPEVLRLVKG